jgi:hypothetical protein
VNWFPFQLQLFALGLLGATAAVPYREIGKYYFKFHATMALLAVTLGVLLGRPWESGTGPFLARACAFAFAGAVLVHNVVVRAAGGELRKDALLFPVSLGAPLVAVTAFALAGFGVGGALLSTLHYLTAAAMLGTSMVAMTTGHWYLSNAKLSFGILTRLCGFFVGSVIAKTVVSGIYAAARWEEYARLEEFWLMVFGVRAGAGELMALVLGLMSLSCARRRANQSATGILYVAVVFVLIGETISLYLTLARGWPI